MTKKESEAKERKRKYNTRWYHKRRRAVLLMVGRDKLYCRMCGSIKKLEINHTKKGGSKEVRNARLTFYKHIFYGKRTIRDLNLLCSRCNSFDGVGKKHNYKNMKIRTTEKKLHLTCDI